MMKHYIFHFIRSRTRQDACLYKSYLTTYCQVYTSKARKRKCIQIEKEETTLFVYCSDDQVICGEIIGGSIITLLEPVRYSQ